MIDVALDLDLFFADFGVPAVRARRGEPDSEPFMVIVGTPDTESHQGYMQQVKREARFMTGACEVRKGDTLRVGVPVVLSLREVEQLEALGRLTGRPAPVRQEPIEYPVLRVFAELDGAESRAWLGDPE